MASVIDDDLKIIHPNTANIKVVKMLADSLIVGNILPFATTSKYVLFRLLSSKGINNKALYNPHITKVQFAPCQILLIAKIIMVFKITLGIEHLLPPKGI